MGYGGTSRGIFVISSGGSSVLQAKFKPGCTPSHNRRGKVGNWDSEVEFHNGLSGPNLFIWA